MQIARLHNDKTRASIVSKSSNEFEPAKWRGAFRKSINFNYFSLIKKGGQKS